MQHHLKNYGKYVEITGYSGVAFAVAEGFLKDNRKIINQEVAVQFFDADLIATWQHLYFAVINALEAFRNKTNLSKSPAMETMLYASAQGQIQRAIQQSGIKPQTTKMAVTIIASDPAPIKMVLNEVTAAVGSEPDESVLEMSTPKEKRIMEAFQISEKEIEIVIKNKNRCEALVNLVVEHMALLATQL
jgi:tRNA threonylcarbamoyladenosine modification (KEOPS) complex Cgi121 subunit